MKKDSQKDHRKAVNEGRHGYKHTPLGWIPDDWNLYNFDDCISIRNGQIDPKKEVYKNEILIAPNHIESRSGRILYLETALQQNAISGKYQVYKGDIIYSKIRPYLQKAAIAPFNCLCSADMYSLFAKNNIIQDYIFYTILSAKFTHIVNGSSARTGIPKVNREELSVIPLCIPPPSQQLKIISILSTWDTAITITQQLIEQLKQRIKGLMQELLTPKKGWHKHRIGDLLKTVKRPVDWNDEEQYNLISVRRRSGGAFFRESLYGKQILTKQLYTAYEGDFLISKMQIVHGASAVVPAVLSGMKVSGSYISLHSKDENKLDISYFNWLSKTKWFYRMAYMSSYGVHIEKMTFDFEDFRRRFIVIPSSVKEQKRIDNILALAKTEVDILEQRLAKLESQKKGLMQKLLTGEFRMSIKESINIF